MQLDEMSRVIGSLEQAVRVSSVQQSTMMTKVDSLTESMVDFKSDVGKRLTTVEEGVATFKKIKERTLLVLALAGVGGGTLGATSSAGIAKIVKFIIGS